MNRRDLKTLLALTACVLTACLAFWMGMRARWGAGGEPPQTDTIVIRDTVVVREPPARDTIPLRTVYLQARAVHDTVYLTTEGEDTLGRFSADTLTMALPLEQKRYESPEYRAWVSGYMASLDSLELYPATRVVTSRSRGRPCHWSLGISAGAAITPSGVEPYLGVGVQYGLVRF